MTDDAELLRQYVEARSEGAFAELVQRHLPMVYSAALRQVGGDAELAKDVAQTVFVDLARKAGSLVRHDLLAGWLYASTRFAAASARRANSRRRLRERIAVSMQEHTTQPTLYSSPAESELNPVLDDAMAELGVEDRHAVLLRFFQDKGLKEVGAILGISEDAARMRLHRALEKLHCLLKARGVALSAGALGSALAAQAVTAAPAGLAASITGAALAGAAAGSSAAFTLMKLVVMTKLKMALVGGVVVAGLAVSLVVESQARARRHDQDQARERQSRRLAQLAGDNQRLSNLLAQASSPPGGEQLKDLPRLRAEAASLRQQTNELARLWQENHRLQRSRQAAAMAQTDLQAKEQAIAKMGLFLDWTLAFHKYAADNQGQCPASFEQAASLLPNRATQAEPALTPDQCEIVFQGSFDTLTNPSHVIVIREKLACPSLNGEWNRAYGFADGHSEIHHSSDGNFEAWEKGLLAAPGQR